MLFLFWYIVTQVKLNLWMKKKAKAEVSILVFTVEEKVIMKLTRQWFLILLLQCLRHDLKSPHDNLFFDEILMRNNFTMKFMNASHHNFLTVQQQWNEKKKRSFTYCTWAHLASTVDVEVFANPLHRRILMNSIANSYRSIPAKEKNEKWSKRGKNSQSSLITWI